MVGFVGMQFLFILYYHSFLIEMWIVINMSAVNNAVNCGNDQKSLKAEKKDHSSDLRCLPQNLD